MKRLVVLVLAALMIVSLFSGCNQESTGPSVDPSQGSSEPSKASDTTSDSSNEPEDLMAVTYPLVDEPFTFECWWVMENNISTVMTSMNDNEYIKYMEELTGIHLDFIHPAAGGEVETFNLMLTANEFPDFIRDFNRYYTRGLDDAVESEIIYDLTDYLAYMPNMDAARTATRENEIQSLTDSGYIAGIPTIASKQQRYCNGLYIRQDWLDELGLNRPETVDELGDILVQLKENYPSTSGGPLWMNNTGSCGLYESFNLPFMAFSQWLLIDGTPTYCLLTDNFRNYITTMADWYDKGLIFNDFLSDNGIIPMMNSQAKVLNGEFGVTYECFVNTDIYNDLGTDTDPGFRLLPIKSPTQVAGEMIHTSAFLGMPKVTQGALAVTTNVNEIGLALRYWDYGFSEEGSMQANFGEEGVTYTLDDEGNPHYTPFALHAENPEELTFYLVQNKYMLQNATYLRDGEREMYDLSPDTLLCDEAWTSNQDGEHVMPSVTLTADEGDQMSRIMGDINTYVDENVVRFITGDKPIRELDDFIAQIESMGIDKVVTLYEAALERYYSRGN